jgi:hypothetical protein
MFRSIRPSGSPTEVSEVIRFPALVSQVLPKCDQTGHWASVAYLRHAAGRVRFEEVMEQRRFQADGPDYRALRRDGVWKRGL